MGCENQNCGSCECEPDPKPESTDKPVLKQFPMAQKRDVVYVERDSKAPEVSFWSFFWGMALGTLFFGC